MSNTYTFIIAEHILKLTFAMTEQNGIDLLPSFAAFNIKEADDGCILYGQDDKCNRKATTEPLTTITVDDSLTPAKENETTRIDTFDTGNGDTIVDSTSEGYQFILKDIKGRSCCLLKTNADFTHAACALKGNIGMRRFGLNNAIMMVYAFRASFFDTLLIHASLVRNNGYGYAFIAKSGTGKSTHTALWLKHIDGTDLMNDDNPIIRIIDGKPYIYGSPWSGKTPCYRNTKAKLGAITKIDRAKANSIERLSPTLAFVQVLPSCSTMRWDKTIYSNTYNTVIKLIETIPSVNILHCLPDEEAARICYKAITVKQDARSL